MFDGEDMALAGGLGSGLTEVTKRSIFKMFPRIPEELLEILPVAYGILILVLKYLGDGKGLSQAVINGILGGIAASLAYKGIVSLPRQELRAQLEAENRIQSIANMPVSGSGEVEETK